MSRHAAPWRLAVLVPLLALGPAVAAPVAAAAAASASAAALTDSAAAREGEYLHLLEGGDTLIGLGRRYLVDPAQWPQLQRLNQVREPRRLPIGKGLRIPLRLMRLQPVPAAVLAARGGVQGTSVGASGGQVLDAGGELVTDADGSVSLRLVDGTVLRLRGNSRLRLQEAYRLPGSEAVRSGVRLEQGRAEVKAQPARAGQPGFRIQTPQGVLAVRGTEYRVSVDEHRTVGEVLEGTVAMAAGEGAARAALVNKDFGAILTSVGVGMPLPLLAPPSLAGLPERHERPLVRLSLPPQPLARAWRVQVGRDASFDILLADVQSATPELRIAGLPDGRYPMRVRAVDAQGVEGRDAQGWLTLKARPEPPLLRAPEPAAVLRGSSVELAWTGSAEAARYHLQLARADAAEPFAPALLDRRDVTGTDYRAQGLAPGRYVWRVGALRADGDAGPMGQAQAFELRALPQTATPPTMHVDERGLRLSWAQGQAGERVELQVARDAGFAEPIAAPLLAEAGVELPPPGPGRYFVRLRRLEADGYVGPWSATQYFDVVDCVRDGSSSCVRTEGGPLQRP